MTGAPRVSPDTERARDPLMGLVASLAAAISLLERTPKAKKAAASDTMFEIMLSDYRKALESGREFALKYRDAAPAQSPWQPIETAPKGTKVLVAQNDTWMAVAVYWPCNSYWTEDTASGLKLNQPTHWMPLPAAPDSSTGGKNP